MKTYILPIFTALCCMTSHVVMANVATTAGSNLTAWNGGSGATNNNAWNTAMNNRTLATGPLGGSNAAAPVADFGNCNALILRCAKPKCTGCTTLELARPIVTGCVNSNSECKKHGDELVEYLSAQLVADATAAAAAAQAEASAQSAAAANAAATAAANANNAQINQLQSQLSQMATAQAESNRQIQQLTQALENSANQPAPTPTAPAVSTSPSDAADAAQSGMLDNLNLSETIRIANENDVDPNLAVRAAVTGEILSDIENAKDALVSLKAAMREVFAYAGCNEQGANCSGPKRVKVFKDRAYKFFEPYDMVADHMYNALESALVIGADVNDVIMMLSGACERWGRFVCRATGVIGARTRGGEATTFYPTYVYSAESCPNGTSVAGKTSRGVDYYTGTNTADAAEPSTITVRGGKSCAVGAAIPPEDDTRCTLSGLITNEEQNEVLLNEWMIENEENGQYVRVGCASNAINGLLALKRGSGSAKKAMDIDLLERILAQDASDFAGRSSVGGSSVRSYGTGAGNTDADRYKYCALTIDGYNKLKTALAQRRMPAGEICVSYEDLKHHMLRSDLLDWLPDNSGNAGSEGGYVIDVLTCAANTCSRNVWDINSDACRRISCKKRTADGADDGSCTMVYTGTWADTGNDGINDNLGQCEVTGISDLSGYTCGWTRETGMVCKKNPQTPSGGQQSDG